MNLLRERNLAMVCRMSLVAVFAILTFAVGQKAYAAWVWSHKWAYSTFYINNAGSGSMATYMTNSANDYHANTDLDIGANGQIQGSESNYGSAAYYQGYTYPKNSSGQNCYYYATPTPTGLCNSTTNKATSGIIYWNTYYLSSNRDYLARHEMGHMFGLYHPYCTDPITVMYTPSCTTTPPTTLQADEKTWINANY